MCGINGALAFSSGTFRVTEPYIDRACATRWGIADPTARASGWMRITRVGLGHRRLSIIDLSDAAAQPMTNEDGSLWLIFNGEIYNHARLRAELEQAGRHRWRTDHSDTEVILHAFEEWGIDCLSRFRGMFAFALWDARARQLWLVRDRIGIKPLYYSIHHGASDVRVRDQGAARGSRSSAAPSTKPALFHYLSFLTTPGPQTLFDGIRKLPPATWMRVGATGTIDQRRYWDVWDDTSTLIAGRRGRDRGACAGRAAHVGAVFAR